jgi:hypothetical protein
MEQDAKRKTSGKTMAVRVIVVLAFLALLLALLMMSTRRGGT